MKIAAREYYYRHQERVKERARIYSKENREICSERRQVWAEKNRDKARATDRARYQRDKEKRLNLIKEWAKKNPEKRKQYCKKWDSENKDNKRVHCRQRQARQRNAVPGWADINAIKKIYAEARRLEVETGERHDVDHIVPLKSKLVCGLHCEANLRVTTMFENRSKNNRYWPDMPEREAA